MLAISIQLSHPGFQEFELVCTGPVVHILKIEQITLACLGGLVSCVDCNSRTLNIDFSYHGLGYCTLLIVPRFSINGIWGYDVLIGIDLFCCTALEHETMQQNIS